MTLRQTGAHACKTSVLCEAVGVSKGGLRIRAELLGDRVGGREEAREVDFGVLDDLAVLLVDTTDLGQCTRGRVVVGDELRHDGELLAGVNGHALAVEVLDAQAERIEVAAIGVAETAITIRGIALLTSAALLAATVGSFAGVGSVCRRDRIGFPNIHLRAARAVLTQASVGIIGRWSPPDRVCLSVDELDISGALGVTIARAVLGAGLVARLL